MRWSRAFLLLGLVFLVTLLIATATYAQPGPSQGASPLVKLTNDGGTDIRPALSPDGKTIAFQSNRGAVDRYHIWTMDTDGKNQKQLTNGALDERHPFWSPDGKTIAYDVNNAGVREIWTMNRDGGQQRQLTKIGADSHFPAFSPDGKQMTFYVYKEGVLSLWGMNADGSNQRPLVPGLADQSRGQCTFACHQALFSPDGKQIAYTGGDHRSIYVMNADGSNPTRIPKSQPLDHQHFPWWLPTGELAYIVETVTNAEAYTDAWVIQPPNGTPALLMGRMAQQGPIEWTPDASRIYFHSPRGGNFDIYTIDLTAPGGVEALQGTIEESAAEHPAGLAGGPGAPRPGDAPAVAAPAPALAATAAEAQAMPEWVWFAVVGGVFLVLGLLVTVGVLLLLERRGRRRRRPV